MKQEVIFGVLLACAFSLLGHAQTVVSTNRVWAVNTCPATAVYDSAILECRTCLQSAGATVLRVPSIGTEVRLGRLQLRQLAAARLLAAFAVRSKPSLRRWQSSGLSDKLLLMNTFILSLLLELCMKHAPPFGQD